MRDHASDGSLQSSQHVVVPLYDYGVLVDCEALSLCCYLLQQCGTCLEVLQVDRQRWKHVVAWSASWSVVREGVEVLAMIAVK